MTTRWDTLKIVALLLMFIDHAGAFFYVDEDWMRAIGRACAPLFLFAAGFAPHYKFDRKLLALAVILSAFDWWIKGAPNTLNILFTIIVIRVLLGYLETTARTTLRLHEWVIGALALTPTIIILQYGSLGALFALAGFVCKHHALYATKTPAQFLFFVTAIYGFVVPLLSEFTTLNMMITWASLALMCAFILWFIRAPIATIALPSLFKYPARYTAEIYVAHLLLLIGFTGIAL